jgi:hypothetical protein
MPPVVIRQVVRQLRRDQERVSDDAARYGAEEHEAQQALLFPL